MNVVRSYRAVTRSCSLPASRINLRTRNSGGIRLNSNQAYDGHIPLNFFENAFLAVGSAVMSLVDPRRGGEVHVSCTSLI
jgi:ubiquinone biosynthesis protein COQ4